MRALIAALALVGAYASGAEATPDDDSGSWGAEATESQADFPNYFGAQLAQDSDGGISGLGVVNLCAACRGFDEYAVFWRGEILDGELVMTGEAQGHYGRWRDVTFRGQSVEAGFRGVLTRASDGRGGEFLMERNDEIVR